MGKFKINITGKGKAKRYYFEGQRIPAATYKKIKRQPVTVKRNFLDLRKISDKKIFDKSADKVLKNEIAKYQDNRSLKQTIKQAREEAKNNMNFQPYFRAKEIAENFFNIIGTQSRYIIKLKGKNIEFTADEYTQLLDELTQEQRLENDKSIDDSPPVVLIFEDFENKILYIDWEMILANEAEEINF